MSLVNLAPLRGTCFIDPATVRELPEALDERGRLRVMPAAFWRETTWQDRMVFGARHGLYCFPTVELVEWLGAHIGERSAIEVGSGSGLLAEAAGIRATDNKMQQRPEIAEVYASAGQATVPYGANVEKLDAADAARKYRPDVIVAAWVTHRYSALRHHAGGNMFGVDEPALLRLCDEYVFIGNEHVHKDKSIWHIGHKAEHPDWLFSRGSSVGPSSRDFIACWTREKAPRG